jgi:hypothetical protein
MESRFVPDIFAFVEVEDFLRDVGGMVSHPFERLGNGHDVERAA